MTLRLRWPWSRRHGPARPGEVRVQIQGLSVDAFRVVSRVQAETAVLEYRDGSGASLRKVPGGTRYSSIVLSRQPAAPGDMWNWYREVVSGQVQRRDGILIVTDARGAEMARWSFRGAWPVRYQMVDARSTVMAEEVELAVEEITETAAAGRGRQTRGLPRPAVTVSEPREASARPVAQPAAPGTEPGS